MEKKVGQMDLIFKEVILKEIKKAKELLLGAIILNILVNLQTI